MLDFYEISDSVGYANLYGHWLWFFKQVAESKDEITVCNVPESWVLLLRYLGATIHNTSNYFKEDSIKCPYPVDKSLTRLAVEASVALRPELADALWRSDTIWNTVGRDHTKQQEFNVCSYNSMYRPEVLTYFEILTRYKLPSSVHGCVISSCSAIKPYPAPHHKAIKELLPEGFHQVIATGVLGIVPEELWQHMPLYDSGIPNLWRCMDIAEWYFNKYKYRVIIVYADFYNRALARALARVSAQIIWVNPVSPTSEYTDLASVESIERLRSAIGLIDMIDALDRFLVS